MLLYQVATAGLSPGDIASPIRWILRRQANARVLLADAQRGRRRRRRRSHCDFGADPVRLPDPGARRRPTPTSATTSGRPHAPGLKTLDDALAIRAQVLLAFERAERGDDRRRAAAAR